MRRLDWVGRLSVFLLAALLTMALLGGAILLANSGTSSADGLSVAEYESQAVAYTASPARGDVQPAASAASPGGVVVVDTSHGSDVSRQDLQPLVRALTEVGFEVQFGDGDVNSTLEAPNVEAFVVVDPSEEFTAGEVDAVQAFTRRGGRLLVLAEPDRRRVSGTLFGATITTRESRVTALTSAYDMSVDTRYLFNGRTNDGNYRHILVGPPDGESFAGVERATLYTAAGVRVQGGQRLLETAPETSKSDTDGTGQYAVAVRKNNVVLVGDTTFLREGRHNVHDNEHLIAGLVNFLATGEVDPENGADEST